MHFQKAFKKIIWIKKGLFIHNLATVIKYQEINFNVNINMHIHMYIILKLYLHYLRYDKKLS